MPYMTELVVGSCLVRRQSDSFLRVKQRSERLGVHAADVLWTGVPAGDRRSMECGAVELCSCRMLRDCVLGC